MSKDIQKNALAAIKAARDDLDKVEREVLDGREGNFILFSEVKSLGVTRVSGTRTVPFTLDILDTVVRLLSPVVDEDELQEVFDLVLINTYHGDEEDNAPTKTH